MVKASTQHPVETILLIYFCLHIGSSIGVAQKSPLDAVYQYSVPVESRTAYLWIPPKCQYVKGVLIAVENALERNWLESPIIRQAATDENLAIAWLGDGRPTKITWEMKAEAAVLMDTMLRDMAMVSGYRELEFAPLIFTGHSWNGRMAWTYPAQRPERVIASVPIRTYPMPDSLPFSDIPLCYIIAQTTELPQYNDGRAGDRDFFWPIVRSTALSLRTRNKNNLLGVVVNPGGCHMDWTDDQSEFLALFIRKACQYRLPNTRTVNRKVVLKPINVEQGWLTDSGNLEPDKYAPAPYAQYKGDPKNAYWFFDEEMARSAVAFNGNRKGHQKQMTTFIQQGDTLPVPKNGQVELTWLPQSDGLSFTLKGGYLSKVPAGLLDSTQALSHAISPVKLYHILGPAIQLDSETFKVQFDRSRPRSIVIMADQPGEAPFRRATQPGSLTFPYVLTKGVAQQINFSPINDQKKGLKALPLVATSSSGLPVQYYIKSGPAIIEGDHIRFTDIPIKSHFPLKIIVVAYQWGRTIAPMYQSAAPVERAFFLKQ